MKKITFFVLGSLVAFSLTAQALTKPGPDADPDGLTYVFYLYYDRGQLFGDRDYEIKFDVLTETFTQDQVQPEIAYKGEILNVRSEVAKTFTFDPKKGDPNLTAGKIMVKGPYVPNGQQVNFFNPQGQQVLTIFVTAASVCNDDGTCTAGAGENEKTCPNDCKKPRATPIPAATIEPSGIGGLGLGFDLNSILIYLAATAGVAVVAWLGWKWWKKRRESAFIPPEPPAPPPSIPGLPDIGAQQ